MVLAALVGGALLWAKISWRFVRALALVGLVLVVGARP